MDKFGQRLYIKLHFASTRSDQRLTKTGIVLVFEMVAFLAKIFLKDIDVCLGLLGVSLTNSGKLVSFEKVIWPKISWI